MPLAMRTTIPGIALAGALSLGLGCGFDSGEPLPPTEGACAQAPGPLLDCPPAVIETPEDACQKLLACGAIALDVPDNDSAPIDYDGCLSFFNRLDEFRIDFALECIQSSTCDDLQDPVCLRHGED